MYNLRVKDCKNFMLFVLFMKYLNGIIVKGNLKVL